MNRKNYQMVWSGACALLCAILPALAMGQAGDPFIENLRVRNEVTSQAIEQSPLGGLLGVIREITLKAVVSAVPGPCSVGIKDVTRSRETGVPLLLQKPLVCHCAIRLKES
ncbi:MAG: hypothetical protein R3F19_33935 [Verrucomicrobiales bacterium]